MEEFPVTNAMENQGTLLTWASPILTFSVLFSSKITTQSQLLGDGKFQNNFLLLLLCFCFLGQGLPGCLGCLA
jgi:hypothetical protein